MAIPLATATIYLYSLAEKNGELCQALLQWATADTHEELLHAIQELPSDDIAFDIHLTVNGIIVGNASYIRADDSQPSALKFDEIHEYGACQGLHKRFAQGLHNSA